MGRKQVGRYHILGGRRLCGTVKIQGSKNAALPMIAAAVLTEEEVVLERCPRISDVEDMAEIVRSLGGAVWWEKEELHLKCAEIKKSCVEEALSKRLRASLLFLGSLLTRTGEAHLAGTGGCKIGKRPTDLHQRAMEVLGARVLEEEGTISARADHPKGTVLCFPKKSVGATENAILFAVGAEGTTRLEFCAREPEIVHLCRFLRAMGADITGEGTEQITISGRRGKTAFSGCRYVVPGDRIAAGTYLLMGAATRGRVVLLDAPLEEMGSVLSLYQKIGGQYARKSGTLIADSEKVQYAVPHVETAEYPGFPTDLQSLYLAAAVTLEGRSCICENVFEDRLRTAQELQKMGAMLQICGKWINTKKSRLHGADVVSRDLRGGAALVSAALAAEGFSTVQKTEFIERGYERFLETLRELGADIIVEKEV